MTIIDALGDRRMLGGLPCFTDLASWRLWLIFLRALYGLPLDGAEQHDFRLHTGRHAYDPPPGGYREAVCIVGRQSGKSRVAAAIAAFEAIVAPAEPDGTETYCALIAQDQRAALRTLFSYAVAPFDHVPALTRMVPSGWRALWRRARRADSLTLDSGVRVAVYPCRPAALRGLRARVVICDELAFFRSSEMVPLDLEMLRAVRPTLATTGGRLVILSSPYAQSGALYDLHRRHFGHDDAPVLVWQASAPAMNPTLPADYVARMETDDPDAYRSEVLGEFRQGISTFLDPDAIAACVDAGVRERAPVSGVVYSAFVDPSGGRRDAFAVAIAHRENDRIVLDVCRGWGAPFNPSGVIAEAADLLGQYRVSDVRGDKYAGEFPAEAFRAHGISYAPSDRDRSQLYLDLLPRVQAGTIVLLDDAALLRELRGLERRRGSSGKDRVDHGPGAHDDRANTAAGVAARLAREAASTPLRIVGGYEPVLGAIADDDPEYLRILAEERVRLGLPAGRV